MFCKSIMMLEKYLSVDRQLDFDRIPEAQTYLVSPFWPETSRSTRFLDLMTSPEVGRWIGANGRRHETVEGGQRPRWLASIFMHDSLACPGNMIDVMHNGWGPLMTRLDVWRCAA